MTYRTTVRRIWKDTHELSLIAPDGSALSKFHVEADSIHGINDMLLKLGELEGFLIEPQEAPEVLPMPEGP